MWNSVAPAWEANASFVDDHLAAATELLLDAAEISEGADVLELASGPGGAGLAAAARVGPAGSVLLSDDAPDMVAAAARRSAELAYVRTALFDESAIDAPEDSFDAVISRHGLMFAEDTAAAVRDAVRVLRPGGRFAAMTWGPRAENPWLGVLLDAVGDELGVPFPPATIRGPFALDDADALARDLREGGLRDVRVDRVAAPMRVATLDEWWERVPKFAGPMAMALAAMQPETRAAIERRARESGARAATPHGDAITFEGCVLIAAGRA